MAEQTMVERVAKAIHAAGVSSDPLAQARAAIEAMRKPTLSMMSEGAAELGNSDYGHAGFWIKALDQGECLLGVADYAWQTMIDAALKD